jgi:hypothetical protein
MKPQRTLFTYTTEGFNGVKAHHIYGIRDAVKYPSRTKQWRELKKMLAKSPFGKTLKVVNISWENFEGDDYPFPF